jgi:ribosomal protein S18 acetylase RimI-like enzyme
MQMIVRFDELDAEQRQFFYRFLATYRPDDDQDDEAHASYYGGELFDYGANVLIAVDGDRIAGCIGIITREIPVKDEAYLVRFHIEGENRSVAEHLLQRAVGLCELHKAGTILAGIAPAESFVRQVVRDEGFAERHQALVLTLDPAVTELRPVREGRLRYRYVDETNRGLFQTLHNDIFRFVPNGGAVSDEEMDELMKKHAATPELLGLAYRDERLVGFYELESTDGEGWIHSIGIDPSFQGQGFGREMLLYLIPVLARHGAERMKLIVMSSNEPAIQLYRRLGFREERVLSVWYAMSLR